MEIHVETKEIHMAKLWRYICRNQGDTHGEAIEISHVYLLSFYMCISIASPCVSP
jgi:hypothetical protein